MRAFTSFLGITLVALTASDTRAQFGGPVPYYPQRFPYQPQYQPIPQFYPNQQFPYRPDRKTIERQVAYQLRQVLHNCGIREVEVDINSSLSRVEVEINVRKGFPRQVVRQRAWYALQSMPWLQGMKIELDIDD